MPRAAMAGAVEAKAFSLPNPGGGRDLLVSSWDGALSLYDVGAGDGEEEIRLHADLPTQRLHNICGIVI